MLSAYVEVYSFALLNKKNPCEKKIHKKVHNNYISKYIHIGNTYNRKIIKDGEDGEFLIYNWNKIKQF